MNRPRDEFFASPAFTRNENNCIVPRHLLNQTIDLFDPTALADHTLEIEIRIIDSGTHLLQIKLPSPPQLVLKSQFLLNLSLLTDIFEDRHIANELFARVA